MQKKVQNPSLVERERERDSNFINIKSLSLSPFSLFSIDLSMAGVRMRELFKKYGKVAIGVHFSLSTASIAGHYVAIKNNVDVESIFEKFGIGVSKKEEEQKLLQTNSGMTDELVFDETGQTNSVKKRNRTAEIVASSGGAFAMALLCNKALFPVRAPITLALTPPISRFLARRQIFKSSV